jgi:hypothetical protein
MSLAAVLFAQNQTLATVFRPRKMEIHDLKVGQYVYGFLDHFTLLRVNGCRKLVDPGTLSKTTNRK